jgi:hypothetical protein
MSHKRALRNDPELRFDRLVDGELSDQEYRALLTALDEEPNGWRRCALAFLEARALGQELCRLRDRALLDAGARIEPPRMQGRSSRRWLSQLATAAAIALAFGLGWSVRGPAPQVVDRAAPVPAPEVARNDVGSGTDAVPASREGLSSEMQPLGNVTLVVDSEDGTTRELELPVFPLEARYANWLTNADPALPPEVQRALHHLGYQVRRDRRLAPVQTFGNHRLFVPMEQVEITPVATRSFQ